MILLLTGLFVARYYLAQREDIDAVLLQLRDNVVADAQNAAGATYAAGVRTREVYETARPRVAEAVEALRARFSR